MTSWSEVCLGRDAVGVSVWASVCVLSGWGNGPRPFQCEKGAVMGIGKAAPDPAEVPVVGSVWAEGTACQHHAVLWLVCVQLAQFHFKWHLIAGF